MVDFILNLLNNGRFIVVLLIIEAALMLYVFSIVGTVVAVVRSAWSFVAIWALLDYATNWNWQPFTDAKPIMTVDALGDGDLALRRLAIAGALWLIVRGVPRVRPTSLASGLRDFARYPAQMRREMRMRSSLEHPSLRNMQFQSGALDDDERDLLRSQMRPTRDDLATRQQS